MSFFEIAWHSGSESARAISHMHANNVMSSM
jgi:hypothetical protein